MPEPRIPDLIATVAPVMAYKGQHFCSKATGFFYSGRYNDLDKTYFITNRHVLISEKNKYYPDHLELRLHVDEDDPTRNNNCEIALYNERGGKKWFEHPDNEIRVEEKKIDIVAIETTDILRENSFFTANFLSESFLPRNEKLELGTDVIVIGYPMGMSDTRHNFPLIKTAHLASVYPEPFEGEPYFIIDGTLKEGMSGSPVIIRPSPISTIGGAVTITTSSIPKNYLLGIHSASYKAAELHIVWFGRAIKEIIDHANGL